MVNKILLIGNTGKDAEVKNLDSGNKIAKFSVATNESYKDKEGEWKTLTEWHNVTCWGKLAERAEKQITKGKLVYIEGKLTYNEYENKDGVKMRSSEINAAVFRVLEKRESTNQEQPQTADASKSPSDDLPF